MYSSTNSRSSLYSATRPDHQLRVVRTEITPAGENIELVRPIATNTLSSAEVVQKLMKQYDYKSNSHVEESDVHTVARAFPNYARQLLKPSEGASMTADTKQDLIGDKYLTEQIKRINEENKKKSILDKWSHLLYEGDKDYYPSSMSLGDQLGGFRSSASGTHHAIGSSTPKNQPSSAFMAHARRNH